MNKTLKKGLIIAAISLAILIVAGWLTMLWQMRTHYEDISHKLSTLPDTQYTITQPQQIIWTPARDGYEGCSLLFSDDAIAEMTNQHGVIIYDGQPASLQIRLPAGSRLNISAMRLKHNFANPPYPQVYVSATNGEQTERVWLYDHNLFTFDHEYKDTHRDFLEPTP